jgi:hypothetical protein
MKRDLKNHIDHGPAASGIIPAVYTATATGVGVDVRDFDSVSVSFQTGAIVAAGLFTPKLQESDDSTNGIDGAWNDVVAADQTGALVNLVASSIQRVGYVGQKRWVRPVATYVSGTSTAIAAMVTRGKPHQFPTS